MSRVRFALLGVLHACGPTPESFDDTFAESVCGLVFDCPDVRLPLEYDVADEETLAQWSPTPR